MVQGESSREKTRLEIQKFLCDNQSSTSKKIWENCTCSKATFYKYLDELYDDDIVICKPQRGKGEDLYELSAKGRDQTKEEILKEKFKDEIDRLPATHIRTLYEFVDKILMRTVSLILDTVILERLLQDLRQGKISNAKLDEMRRQYNEQKKLVFEQRPHFFTQEDIDQMSRAPLSEKESDILSQERIKWFEKWFGTLI
jgi:predicted transcriptional regulator